MGASVKSGPFVCWNRALKILIAHLKVRLHTTTCMRKQFAEKNGTLCDVHTIANCMHKHCFKPVTIIWSVFICALRIAHYTVLRLNVTAHLCKLDQIYFAQINVCTVYSFAVLTYMLTLVEIFRSWKYIEKV